MEFAEYRFRADALQAQRAQAVREQMTAATFTAWQMYRTQGGKMAWGKYLDAMGLGAPRERVAKEEKDEALEAAASIARLLKAKG